MMGNVYFTIVRSVFYYSRSTNQYTRPIPNESPSEVNSNGVCAVNGYRSSTEPEDSGESLFTDSSSKDIRHLNKDRISIKSDIYEEQVPATPLKEGPIEVETLEPSVKIPLGPLNDGNKNREALNITETYSEKNNVKTQCAILYPREDVVNSEKVAFCRRENEENGEVASGIIQVVSECDVDEGVDTFFCPWCILSFADELSLAYHLEARHSGAPIGTATFTAKCSSRRYQSIPAFPYQCTICGFKYVTIP